MTGCAQSSAAPAWTTSSTRSCRITRVARSSVRRPPASPATTRGGRRACALGNIDAAKDAVRDERGGRIINDAIDDTRIGLRGLRKNPGFGLAVVLSLALGVGGTTATFSVVHAVVLRALPYPDARQLHILRIWWNDFSSTVSPADVIALDETARAVGSTASFSTPMPVSRCLSPSGPEVVDGVFVTDHLPDVLGIRPEVGGDSPATKTGTKR